MLQPVGIIQLDLNGAIRWMSEAEVMPQSLASAKISPDMVGGGRNSRNLRAKARQLFRAHQVLLRTLIAGRK
jgi:hypothetical protein